MTVNSANNARQLVTPFIQAELLILIVVGS